MEDIRIYKEFRELRQVAYFFMIIIIVCVYFIYKEYMFLTKDYITSGLIVNMASMLIEGIIIVVLGKFSISLVNKILLKEPFIIFEKNDIISNGLIGKFEIEWDEIESYTETYFRGMPTIVLKFKKDSKHKQESSILRQLVYYYNIKRMGGELAFMLPLLDGKYDDVLKYINDKVRNY